eukprot:CAMPEP_0118912278 /NCGR_PEP_ID=MMETSP1166-20130328/13601_1 /TAXON_ID=1104430 /ORGANISM="Chrysoreinhardia sp, Strain CCMP3193" /LENGTH=178 /DNA_ID=CAMNT_0006851793 /DNA_START=45 /DNA_END=581 /DNA_ORIENTATION=-
MVRRQVPDGLRTFLDTHPGLRRRIFKDPDQAANVVLAAVRAVEDVEQLTRSTTLEDVEQLPRSTTPPPQLYVVGGKLEPPTHPVRASPESRDSLGIRHTWHSVVGPRLDAALIGAAGDPTRQQRQRQQSGAVASDDNPPAPHGVIIEDLDRLRRMKARLDRACEQLGAVSPTRPPSAS